MSQYSSASVEKIMNQYSPASVEKIKPVSSDRPHAAPEGVTASFTGGHLTTFQCRISWK